MSFTLKLNHNLREVRSIQFLQRRTLGQFGLEDVLHVSDKVAHFWQRSWLRIVLVASTQYCMVEFVDMLRRYQIRNAYGGMSSLLTTS